MFFSEEMLNVWVEKSDKQKVKRQKSGKQRDTFASVPTYQNKVLKLDLYFPQGHEPLVLMYGHWAPMAPRY